MLKKSAATSLKNQTDKLRERLETMKKDSEELVQATGMPLSNVSEPSD